MTIDDDWARVNGEELEDSGGSEASIPRSSEGEDTGGSIIGKIEASRTELLDLSLRNPLLNYRTLKSRGVEVVDEIPSAVFDILVNKARPMSFLPSRDDDKQVSLDLITTSDEDQDDELGQPKEDDSSPDGLAPRHTDSRLQTDEPSGRLQSRLLNTYYAANTVIQEQGVNTLFIALGMVEWYASDTSEIMRRAPLVLVPVKIMRPDVRGRFYISYTFEELGANLSFIEKVRNDFGIEIPGLPNDEDLDVNGYFTEFSSRVEDLHRWSVDRGSVVLGFFSFGKFLMYRDLDPDTWPEGTGYGPRESGIIRALFGGGFSEPDPKIQEEDHLDDYLNPEDIHHVVDADSSQALAIFDVNQGRNLVIQGPPGTGKSQTIMNIIAEAIGGGRTVLFVSEKMAALEVVKHRLDAIGLGVACLELHSHKTTKRALLDELKKTLELGPPSVDGIEDDFSGLAHVRSRLNTYAEAVNSPVGNTGATPYRAYGELIRIRDQEQQGPPLRRVDIAGIDLWSAADFKSKLRVVSEFQTRLGRVGVPEKHLFWGSRLRMLLPNDQAVLKERIDRAVESLETLVGNVRGLTDSLGLNPPEDVAQTETLLPVAERAAKTPDIQGVDLSAFEQHSQRDTMKRLVDAGSSWVSLHSKYDDILEPSAWDADVRETRDTLSTVGRKFWRSLSPNYRRAQKHLAELCLTARPESIEGQREIVDAILQEQEHRRMFERLSPIAEAVLGPKWQGADSDWEAVGRVVEWALALFSDIDHGVIALDAVRSLRNDMDTVQVGNMLGQVRAASDSHANCLDALQSFLQMDNERRSKSSTQISLTDTGWVRLEGLIALPFVEQGDILATWSSGIDKIHDLAGFNGAAHHAEEEGLGSIVELGAEWTEAVRHLRSVLERAWYEYVLSRALKERPALGSFAGDIHEQLIGRFCSMDELALDHNRARAAHSHWSELPKYNAGGQLRTLRREFEKKRRHLPIRQLVAQAGNVIQAIKPVFMMSPMSIATYLSPGSVKFDLVVFDEASQVRPVDALGALMRADQSVVVGDSKQLPPTRFFDAVTQSDDEDDSVVTDMESILGLFRAEGAPDRMLRWHYRSRHESLIAVSNREFYENGLVVFPSPDSDRDNLGLRYHYLPDTDYDRARSRTNRKEAAKVAMAVMEHARQSSQLTLGVAAFSSAQMGAIQDELERLRRQDPSCEAFFNYHPEEPFFVKNLENVQGDERDVIFISVGYGRDAYGKVAMNFGPLTTDGGERRLNVLITRAKLRCHVFTNLRASDIDLNRTSSRGVRALKTFLAYAETGVLEDALGESGREIDSPFQKAVASKLRSLGYDIREEVAAGGKFIDLAVVDPEHPGRYILGIECDGATYHGSRWARDRDRLREQHLKNLGWRLYRIWSTDWFHNLERELNRAVEAIEQAKAAAPADRPLQNRDRSHIERVDPKEVGSDLAAQRYELARISVDAHHYELHEVPAFLLHDPIIQIVRVEGPVHVSEVQHRIVDAVGVARIGHRIKQNLDLAIANAERRGRVVRKGDFLWSTDMDVPVVRDRSDLQGKRIDMVSLEEIAEALKMIVRHSYGIDREEAASETARLLGFRNVSKNTGRRIYPVMERLIGNGDLVAVGAQVMTANEA